MDPDLGAEAYGPDVDDDMNDAWSESVTLPHYFIFSTSIEDNTLF